MNSEIITVGSELLSGRQLNTNAKYLSDKLMSIGIDVDYHKFQVYIIICVCSV